MTRKYFGTDGVRGPYGGALINEQFAARLAHAAVTWLRREGERRQTGPAESATLAVERREEQWVGRVLIGRDTRESGAALQAAVAAGVQAAGAEAVFGGTGLAPAQAKKIQTARTLKDWIIGLNMSKSVEEK